MKSLVVKRSIVIRGHKTSVCLEDAFWTGFKEIAMVRGTTLSNLIGFIDAKRLHGNLSSTIRLFVLEFYRLGKHDCDVGTSRGAPIAGNQARPRLREGKSPARTALRRKTPNLR